MAKGVSRSIQDRPTGELVCYNSDGSVSLPQIISFCKGLESKPKEKAKAG